MANAKDIETYLNYATKNGFLDDVKIGFGTFSLWSTAKQAYLTLWFDDMTMTVDTCYIDTDGDEKTVTEIIGRIRKDGTIAQFQEKVVYEVY